MPQRAFGKQNIQVQRLGFLAQKQIHGEGPGRQEFGLWETEFCKSFKSD